MSKNYVEIPAVMHKYDESHKAFYQKVRYFISKNDIMGFFCNPDSIEGYDTTVIDIIGRSVIVDMPVDKVKDLLEDD